jgi:putative phosphoribosyl transferase
MTDAQTVVIPISERESLEGNLTLPADAWGEVLFAHGSGSSRHSPRNRYVAEVLQRLGLATLLVDLLTASEERKDRDSGYLRFNIELLAHRLRRVTDWFLAEPVGSGLPLGYFGASTGAAAALMAAASDSRVSAIVSRGGRPDLAGSALSLVQAATLLIVGGADTDVLSLNRAAYKKLPMDKRLEVIPGATHLFEEPGALEQVAALAGGWFEARLAARAPTGQPRDARPSAEGPRRVSLRRSGRHPAG